MSRIVYLYFPENTEKYLKDYNSFIEEKNKEFTVSVVLYAALFVVSGVWKFIWLRNTHKAGVLQTVLEVSG